MSCRILGRKVEDWILNEIVLKLRKMNISKLNSKFLRSKKNQICENFMKIMDLKLLNRIKSIKIILSIFKHKIKK